MYEKYITWENNEVWTRKDLKGQRNEYCLCMNCEGIYRMDKKKRCKIAMLLNSIDDVFHTCTATFECPDFKPRNIQQEESDDTN